MRAEVHAGGVNFAVGSGWVDGANPAAPIEANARDTSQPMLSGVCETEDLDALFCWMHGATPGIRGG